MIDGKEFLKVLKILELNYNKELPDSIASIWYNEFKNYSKEKIENLFIESIKEYTYFPTINQVKNINSGKIVYERI